MLKIVRTPILTTKTLFCRDLHIMTHNAKHSPVSRLQECPTPTTPKKSPFDGLPDSVVIKILSNLNSNQIVKCSR